MPNARSVAAGLALVCAAACSSPPPAVPRAAADSTWIRIDRPAIVAVHPLAFNEQLDAEEFVRTGIGAR